MRILSFGASITYGSELPSANCTWASIIAQKLEVNYLCLAKPGSANTTIARQILSYPDYANDFALVMWTSCTRYEFMTHSGLEQITPWVTQKGFVKEWYKGPGHFEFTEISNTLRDVLLAKQFLESIKIPYLFVFDNNEFKNSSIWHANDPYIAAMKEMMPWDNILWFEGEGFINWAKNKNYEFVNSHPGVVAHKEAADYILSNWSFSSLKTNKFPA